MNSNPIPGQVENPIPPVLTTAEIPTEAELPAGIPVLSETITPPVETPTVPLPQNNVVEPVEALPLPQTVPAKPLLTEEQAKKLFDAPANNLADLAAISQELSSRSE